MIWRGKKPEPELPGAISLLDHPELGADYFELARFWVSADQGRSLCLVGFPERWSPELLGALLVESIHTAAGAYAEYCGIDQGVVLDRIWTGLDRERSSLDRTTESK